MIGDTIKSLRQRKKIYQQELANNLSVSKSAVAMWETNKRTPDADTLIQIADYFDVSVDYLLGKTDIKKEPSEDGDIYKALGLKAPMVASKTVTMPVIGEIAAGYDYSAMEDWTGDTVEIPEEYFRGRDRSDFFVLSVRGDSMYPLYMDGDKVLILKQSTMNRSGEIGVVLYNGDYATLKKIEYVQGEDWIKLIPLNPEYAPKTITGVDLESCRILGIPRLLIREID